jgi:GntR family transcriptional regulator, rspAB operon transcriptional repressor
VSDNAIELNPVDIPNLNEVVYNTLRQAILQYDFEPGQRLDLSELESRLQVSRTPLKNAMTRLEVEGLVQVQARRGTFVAEISAAKLEEDYKIRSAYELYVALCLYKYLTSDDYDFFAEIGTQMEDLALKARRSGWQDVIHDYLKLDRALHQHLVGCGGPPRMVTLWQQTNVHMQVARLSGRIQANDFETCHFEHRQILDALAVGSPERLNAALLNHLESSRFTILRMISDAR